MKAAYCLLLVSGLWVFASAAWAQSVPPPASLSGETVAQDTLGAPDSLVADTDVLYLTGGKVNFTLDAGAGNAGRDYLLLGSLSGTTPGIKLPGGGILPLNWDLFSYLVFTLANTPFFVDFLGTLDGAGTAAATFDTLGPLPPTTPPGIFVDFAFTTYHPFDFQSNSVSIEIQEAPLAVYVDDSNTTGIEDGTMDHPFNTIQEGINAASSGMEVWVDDSGAVYHEAVILKDGVALLSKNWDASDGSDRASIESPGGAGVLSVSGTGIAGASLVGFNIYPGGYLGAYVPFLHLVNCTNLLVSDCYFNGLETPMSMVGIDITGGSGIEIGHCHLEQIHGPDPGTTGDSYRCIQANGSAGLDIHNVRMNDIATNFDPGGHVADALLLESCDDAVIHNTLTYNIKVSSGGAGAGLVTGFSLSNCANPVLYNNTVDSLNTVNNFFINQAFGYILLSCENAVFYNNIVSNVSASGFPPPLDRGVQGGTYPLPCDYTLTWSMSAPYFGTAYANLGCQAADPLYLDPQNGDYDLDALSEGQLGDPFIVDWDDGGPPSGDPGNPDPETRSRMGCHGGPDGETVGLLTAQ